MRQRIAQLSAAFQQTRAVDPKLVPFLAASAGGTLAVFLVVAAITGGWVLWPVLGVVLALLVALSVFGRRAQAAQLTAIEGQPGAAAAVLNVLRGQWFLTPAVAVTRKQEFVHRVVGRPGVILVGEGSSTSRVKQLVAQERKRHERATDAPVHTFVVGDGDGEVELRQLTLAVQKLPRALKKTEVPKVERRLAALNKANIPMPKGYVPQPGKKQR